MLSIFRKKTKEYNIYHPENVKDVEFAFKCGSVKYYRFKKDTRVRTGRYIIASTFVREFDLRLTRENMETLFITPIKMELSGKKGTINIAHITMLIQQLEARLNMALEEETLYRLASVMYFDDKEELHGYDKEHNEAKIKDWKKSGDLSFFFQKPMSDFLTLENFSQTDLKTYLSKAEEFTRQQTDFIQMLSSTESSENSAKM